MKLFEVLPANTSQNDFYINATHKWSLPGVKCSECGVTWSNTGLAYPDIDLSHFSSKKAYIDGWPVPFEKFEQLQRPIIQLMNDISSLPLPGTEFGPLVGEIRGKIDKSSFIWVNPWTLLVRRKILFNLQKLGVRTPKAIDTELTYKGHHYSDLIEFQIEPLANLAMNITKSDKNIECSLCGHRAISKPERVVIQKVSLSDDIDLFRAREITTLILASERFLKAVENLDKDSILFQEVDIL